MSELSETAPVSTLTPGEESYSRTGRKVAPGAESVLGAVSVSSERDQYCKAPREECYDIIVIGAGHAGCEAALACARSGLATLIFTISVDSIALMPCNPNVGGTSKGHLVREVDALGGEMARVIDATFIQSRMLNASKGPAVHSLRAQADKAEYSREMRKRLEAQENLHIRQGEVCAIETKADDGGAQHISGVYTDTGTFYPCRALILCSGTYLNARCLTGECISYTGPNGLKAAQGLSESLSEHGIKLRRFKTGTPARMDGASLDYAEMQPQHGDTPVIPFSFSTDPDSVQIDQVDCYLTYTNEETHKIIRDNLDRSPIYAGIIEGTGPRYCPSIEDKVVRFADKERHQVFIEPEGLHTNEMYVGGMSSSLPEDVQLAMYRTVPGLRHCRIVRNAYAIEYDCLSPGQLKLSLELKAIEGFFCAGQFCGSSGYEEAAAQGLIAGINAVKKIKGQAPLILGRDEAYIGVLIDDLVNKENPEPYRMMTARAEYRLLLRQDNADLRLSGYGYEAGLLGKDTKEAVEKKRAYIEKEVKWLHTAFVGANKQIQDFLAAHGSAPIRKATSLAELICRPELSYELVKELPLLKKAADEEAEERPALPQLDQKRLKEAIEQIDIEIKYEGYIRRQQAQVEQFRKMESRRIPPDIDYDAIKSLRLEAAQKLKAIRPESVGQASRISGVSPADIAVLMVYLR